MIFEQYSDRYAQDVLALVRSFHGESTGAYDGTFSPEAVSSMIRKGDASNCFLFVKDGTAQGILYGVVVQSMTSSWLMFQELIWYMNRPFRKYGVTLLREAERILKSRGVNAMIMAVMENSKTEKIKRFYERIGYKPMEVHYMKEL